MGITEYLEKEKKYYQNMAWEYFRKKEKLPEYLTEEQFYNKYAGTELNEKLGAFRHTYTSAAFTKKYGEDIAALLGNANELKQFGIFNAANGDSYKPGNEPQDRRMDLKNNAAGREIAKKYTGNDLLGEVYSQIGKNPKIITNQYINNDEPYIGNPVMNKVWDLMDWGYENKDQLDIYTKPLQYGGKLFKNAKNFVTGQAANLSDDYDYDDKYEDYSYDDEPRELSFREKLIRDREERLARYTQRLAEKPENVAERESKHTSLEELMAPQEARRQRIHDIVQGTVEFDEDGNYSSYQNKKSGDNKIFTQEEIDEMSDEERKKNQESIFYQKQTIGIPTKKQAEKAAAKGGMVYVNAYVRKDGTKVKAYYRSR